MIERLRVTVGQLSIWLMAGSLVLLLALAAGCSPSESRTRQGGGRQPAIAVQATSVQHISIQRQVDIAGTLVSPDQANVSSEVSGIVREVAVELGAEVKPGQVLVKLEPRELELALRQIEGQMHQTEAQLGIDGVRWKEPPPDDQIASIRTASANRDDARAQAARASQLFHQGLLTQSDFDTVETRVKVTEAAYQAAFEQVQSLKATLHQRRAAYELAQKKLSDSIIKAPIAGSISARLVQPGEFIRENTAVVTIVQVHPLKLNTAIQEKYASVMHPGLAAEFKVESAPDETFQGKVAYISPSVDQATRTFPVEILVNNSDRRLKPGFFAKGAILTRVDGDVLAVPDAAVSTLAGDSSVFVIENGVVRKQTVTLGIRAEGLIEIVDGLAGNETLATSNLSELADGITVSIGGEGTPAEEGQLPPRRPSKRGGRP